MKVISLFDGISCGRVALERAEVSIEEYHAWEIEPNAISIGKKNYPNNVYHGDVTEADFESFKEYDLLIGGSPCFTKGHYVLTETGYKDISEVAIGDKVLTHTGNYKPVISTMAKKSKIYELCISGSVPIYTTEEHPFYTLYRHHNTSSQYLLTKSYRYFSEQPAWTKVVDLTTDHFCGQHIHYVDEQNPYNIDEELAYILGRYLADGHLRKTRRKNRKDIKCLVLNGIRSLAT